MKAAFVNKLSPRRMFERKTSWFTMDKNREDEFDEEHWQKYLEINTETVEKAMLLICTSKVVLRMVKKNNNRLRRLLSKKEFSKNLRNLLIGLLNKGEMIQRTLVDRLIKMEELATLMIMEPMME